MKMMFEVSYIVRSVILAENNAEAVKLAAKEFGSIVLDQSFEVMDVRLMGIPTKWDGYYVPYGDNPKGLTIDQIETKNKLGWEY